MTATEAQAGRLPIPADLWTPCEAEMAAYERDQSRAAEAILAHVRTTANRLGLAIDTVHVPDCRAARAILDTARRRGCDAIVTASHGRSGMGQIMLGSHTAEVLASADIPVIVFP